MARLRPVPPGPDTLGSGAEVGLHHASGADPDLALTHRSEVGHAPGSTTLRRAVPAARACAGGRRPRRERPRPHRHAGRPQGRRHHPHAGDRAPDEHVAAQPDALRTDDVVRLAPDGRRQRVRRLPADAAPDQGRLRLRERPAGSVGAVEPGAAGRRLEHRAVPRRADGRRPRAALRHGHGVRTAVPRHPGGRAAARARVLPRRPEQLQPPGPRRGGRRRLRVGPARRVRPGRQAHRRSGVGHRPGHRRRPWRPGEREQRGRPDRDHVDQPVDAARSV